MKDANAMQSLLIPCGSSQVPTWQFIVAPSTVTWLGRVRCCKKVQGQPRRKYSKPLQFEERPGPSYVSRPSVAFFDSESSTCAQKTLFQVSSSALANFVAGTSLSGPGWPCFHRSHCSGALECLPSETCGCPQSAPVVVLDITRFICARCRCHCTNSWRSRNR